MDKNFNIPPFIRLIVYSVIGLLYLLAMRMPYDSNTIFTAPYKNFFAPDFQLQDLKGQSITLSDYSGIPVLLNFWAAWCPPCQAELPFLKKIVTQYPNNDFKLISINTTYQDNLEEVKKMVSIQQLPFPVLLDYDGQVSRLYQINALPTSFFIDKEGKIYEIIYGGLTSEVVLEINLQKVIHP